MNEHALRRERLGYALEEAQLDALFLPLSSDLEYLTGIERDLPSFGETAQAHAWLAGAFFGSLWQLRQFSEAIFNGWAM